MDEREAANTPWEENRDFQEEHGVTYGMFTCGRSELKIVVRSNPGIVWLKDGVVQQKWAWRDVPAWRSWARSNGAKVLHGLGVLWGTLTLVFMLFAMAPDPARQLAGPK